MEQYIILQNLLYYIYFFCLFLSFTYLTSHILYA